MLTAVLCLLLLIMMIPQSFTAIVHLTTFIPTLMSIPSMIGTNLMVMMTIIPTGSMVQIQVHTIQMIMTMMMHMIKIAVSTP